jgi:hypothetical protein
VREIRDRLVERIERGARTLSDTRFLHTEPHHDDLMLGYLPYIVRHVRDASNSHFFACLTGGFTSVTNAFMQDQLARLRRFIDTPAFGALMAVRIVTGTFTPGKPELNTIPDWLFTAYDLSHSLVVAGAVWLVLWFTARWIAVPFSAWLIHILLDIPTHTRAYFPTPFLWPFSDYTFDGFSWGQGWFMLLNYSCLLVLALCWTYFRQRRRQAGDGLHEAKVMEGITAEDQPADASSLSSISA